MDIAGSCQLLGYKHKDNWDALLYNIFGKADVKSVSNNSWFGTRSRAMEPNKKKKVKVI